jgi:hypothetical protein
VLSYGSEIRASKQREWNIIQTAEIKYLRTVKGCTGTDHLRNEDIRNELGIFPLHKLQKIKRSRDSVVGIATGYGLDDRGFGIRVPVGSRILFLHVVQTGSEAHPPSYPMGTGASSPGVKLPGREADDSLPASAEVKKMWIYTSTPPYVFVA